MLFRLVKHSGSHFREALLFPTEPLRLMNYKYMYCVRYFTSTCTIQPHYADII